MNRQNHFGCSDLGREFLVGAVVRFWRRGVMWTSMTLKEVTGALREPRPDIFSFKNWNFDALAQAKGD